MTQELTASNCYRKWLYLKRLNGPSIICFWYYPKFSLQFLLKKVHSSLFCFGWKLVLSSHNVRNIFSFQKVESWHSEFSFLASQGFTHPPISIHVTLSLRIQHVTNPPPPQKKTKKHWFILLPCSRIFRWLFEKRDTLLTHFSLMSHFYTPWKRQKTIGFLLFSGGIEMWH